MFEGIMPSLPVLFLFSFVHTQFLHFVSYNWSAISDQPAMVQKAWLSCVTANTNVACSLCIWNKYILHFILRKEHFQIERRVVEALGVDVRVVDVRGQFKIKKLLKRNSCELHHVIRCWLWIQSPPSGYYSTSYTFSRVKSSPQPLK